jgi:hypothetical protein
MLMGNPHNYGNIMVRMQMKKLFLLIMLLAVTSPCFAKAYYARKKDMIKEAEAIVIAEITKVEDSENVGKPWSYRQKASATVKHCLKGEAKGEIEIYGMETFICAQCRYKKGNFILFLRKKEDFWVGSNWHLGIRPIANNKTQWFKDDETHFELKETSLTDVINEIDAVVKKQMQETPNKLDLGDGK